jgi:hypothetical protein
MKDLTIRPFENIIDQESYKDLTDQVRELCKQFLGSFNLFSYVTVLLEKLNNEETLDVYTMKRGVIVVLTELTGDQELLHESNNPFSDIFWNTVKTVNKKYYPLILWLQHQYILSCIEDYNSNVEKFIK